MKRKTLVALFTLIIIVACQPQKSEQWLLDNEKIIQETFNNDDFKIINADYLNNQLLDLKMHEKHLNQVNENKIAESSQVILNNLKKDIQTAIITLEKDSIYHWDATKYNLGIFIKKHFKNENTKAEDFSKINEILIQSDTFFSAAKQNLTAIQIEKGKKAIEENVAFFHWLNDELNPSLQSIKLPADKRKNLQKHVKNTSLNIKDFIGFINSLINNTDDKTYPTTIVKKN